MTQKEQAKAANNFAKQWSGKGDEKQETSRFWIQLLQNVLGVSDPAGYIEFEKKVQLSHTSFIDAYIPETRVLIEQKGASIDLQKKAKQSDDSMLTPFEQARRYVEEMKVSEKPRWVVVCNFQEFDIYDFEKEGPARYMPDVVLLKDLEKEYHRLSFLVDETNVHLQKEKDLTFKSGELVGLLYDKLKVQYGDETDENLKHLNKLCVRLVFCLYAEDAGIFGKKSIFGDYLKRYDADSLRDALLNLFRILDKKEEERSKYEKTELLEFPYVNGGLFSGATLDEIPQLTDEIKTLLVTKASDDFDWSRISPTIFGSLFESTLNQETRRSGGMHYTSIENIHKVIDPLFMNDLNKRFEDAIKMSAENRSKKLKALQTDLGKFKFLDPACGSGNFLTETYLSLRRLENKILKELSGGTGYLDFGDIVKVRINQFYGIEINDFAVSVAKTALWIAESQMLEETEGIVNQNFDFLPLKSNANIVEGNALRIDWNTLCPAAELSYIIGNPPFVGTREMKDDSIQKQDMSIVFGSKWKGVGSLDYVSGWYLKCAEIMQANPEIKTALVSTNSITQGTQVTTLWKPLIEKRHVSIDFAYRTFRWDNGAKDEAHVHCVIIGFSCSESSKIQPKYIYNADGNQITAKNIHPYLIDFPNVFIKKNKRPLAEVPEMIKGCYPTDNGNYIFEKKEMADFIKKEPLSAAYFRRWIGSNDMINNEERYILFVKDIAPDELKKMPLVRERIAKVREFRLKSDKEAIRKKADTPQLLDEERIPTSTFLVVPVVSSESRKYIPLTFRNIPDVCYASCFFMENVSLYLFGILTSSVHNVWMRTVCGRLESRYRYSNTLVYNTFPWCNPSEIQRKKVEQTAQAIIDARAKYPNSSLADMYGAEMYLFPELYKAHAANDAAVLAAYGWPKDLSEEDIVTRLFKMYEKLTSNQPETKSKGRKKI